MKKSNKKIAQEQTCDFGDSGEMVLKKIRRGFLNLDLWFRALVYLLPLVLFFSYWPPMHFGSDESMNFEISLPLIWLVVFGVAVLIKLVQGRELSWQMAWLLLPVWLTISVAWSLNSVRGILTVGILWLVYLARYGMWTFRSVFDVGFRKKWLKGFFVSTLFVCIWCVVQCVLDIVGVGRDYSLMCAGCTYAMFGFPHPNGFAIEPQFMGNLLLAPGMAAGWLVLKNNKIRVFSSVTRGEKLSDNHKKTVNNSGNNFSPAALRLYSSKTLILLFFVITATLFLTFSRGAIYAFVVGMTAMTVGVLLKNWQENWKKVGTVWLGVVLAFGVALSAQGLMAEVSPTTDTFDTGVAKVLNHLSLGIIDVRNDVLAEEKMLESDEFDVENSVEKPVENFAENSGVEVAVFDGYAAESTDIRTKLTIDALEVWRKDFGTVMFGVGLGGAGQALYKNELSSEPKEIVQNEYASLLLETGLVGIALMILTLVLVVRVVRKSKARAVIFSLLLAYAVTLCFFSGLPNALQIYLLPVALMVML